MTGGVGGHAQTGGGSTVGAGVYVSWTVAAALGSAWPSWSSSHTRSVAVPAWGKVMLSRPVSDGAVCVAPQMPSRQTWYRAASIGEPASAGSDHDAEKVLMLAVARGAVSPTGAAGAALSTNNGAPR